MKEFFLAIYIAVLGWFGVATPVTPPQTTAPEIVVLPDNEQEISPSPVVQFSSSRIAQGESVALRLCPENARILLDEITSVTIGEKSTPFGVVEGCISAFYGTDIKLSPRQLVGIVRFRDGTSVSATTTVVARPRIEAPLGIPEKLGGNTPAAATKVVNTLALENTRLASLRQSLVAPREWNSGFMRPVAEAVITDSYGYVRDTVGQEITHKGTDYRASVGAPVYAPQDGIVIESGEYTIYGKTIVIDHGLGVTSMLMHLSESLVEVGERVVRGQLVAKAGATGYAESPHLHLSIRIGGISIDPESFYALFSLPSVLRAL